jgi:hypothetical protein
MRGSWPPHSILPVDRTRSRGAGEVPWRARHYSVRGDAGCRPMVGPRARRYLANPLAHRQGIASDGDQGATTVWVGSCTTAAGCCEPGCAGEVHTANASEVG